MTTADALSSTALSTEAAMQAIRLSEEQLAIAGGVKNRALGNILVVARAGTGKTFLILQCLNIISGRAIVVAYNSKIAKEIKGKIAKAGHRHAEGSTFHALGLRVLSAMFPRAKVEGRGAKNAGYKKITRMMAEVEVGGEKGVPKYLQAFVRRATSMAMCQGFGVGGMQSAADLNAWREMVSYYRIDAAIEDDGIASQMAIAEIQTKVGRTLTPYEAREEIIKLGLRYSYACMNLSRKLLHEVISYDDMLWAPLAINAELPCYDFVFVDEAQDSNPVRVEWAARMIRKGGRLMFVGDNCQPLGTQVSIPGAKTINIEDLKVGDDVVSYESNDCAFVMGGRKVNGITRRPYIGDLIRIETEDGKVSKYTPNHICLVNFENIRDKHIVYVMRKGDQFRVGKCKAEYTTASEKADAAWILSVHDTEHEAYYQEQAVSGRYGLPQLCFDAKNMQRGPAAEYLPKAWAFIGSNFERGFACLSHFGRDIWHPLFETGTDKQQTIKRPILTRASNLITGCKVLPFDGNSHTSKSEWKTITVSTEWYEGDVVSLDVGGSKLYVADGITTHNCQAIYGFTGAMSNALDKIRDRFTCTVFKMTVTFRCSQAVAALAAKMVPDYKAAASNPEGSVSYISEAQFGDMVLVPGEDAIICRNTRPLVRLAYDLMARGIPCHIEGKEVGEDLIMQIDQIDNRIKSVAKFLPRMDEWLTREIAKMTEADAEMEAEALSDKIEAIRVVMRALPNGSTVDDAKAKITALFGDKDEEPIPTVALMTAHKSKGLEFHRVFGWGVTLYMPSKRATMEHEIEQEFNLEYVLRTRAILDYIEVEVNP